MTTSLKHKPLINLIGAAAFVAAGLTFTPTFAAGDSDSSTVPSCKRGHAYDKKKMKCVKVKKKSGLSDDNIYESARDLAYSKRYDEAITLLRLAENQNDPRILNYLGYATRKAGNVEKGLGYYQAAIKADPNYTLARSYMGEAFLQLNQPAKAKQQLAEIGKRCGISCREYGILEKAIKEYRS